MPQDKAASESRSDASAALVVGGDSMIGRRLAGELAKNGRTVFTTSRRPARVSQMCQHLDLAADVASWQPPPHVRVAYLCAAITSLEQCRSDPAGSRRVNVDNTLVLAEKLAARGALVIFPSSNLVFDGDRELTPADAGPAPRTEYGRQKAAAERRLLELGEPVAVVRLAKVLPDRFPLMEQWHQDLCNGVTIRPFHDCAIAPTPLSFAVDVLCRIGDRRATGIFQVSGPTGVTYEAIARRLATRMGVSGALVKGISAIASGKCLEPAPRYATLDTGRLQHELGITPPGTWATIEHAIEAIVRSEESR